VLTADALILGLVIFFAAWGAITGASRQLAQLGAIFVAYFSVRLLTKPLSPFVSRIMDVGAAAGTFFAGAFLFAFTVFVVRLLLTRALERLLVGKDAKTRAPDRWLGFLFGGLKAAAGCYVLLACIVYAQENVQLAGRRLNWVSRKSWAYQWTKEHNLLGPTVQAKLSPRGR
jgi:membrane protein required for colicin V production